MSKDEGMRDVQLEALEDAVAERSDQANETDWTWGSAKVATMRGVAVCARILLFCARRLHGIERLLAEQVQATRDAAYPVIETEIMHGGARWRLVHTKGLAHLYRDGDYVFTKRGVIPVGFKGMHGMIESVVAEVIAAEKAAPK